MATADQHFEFGSTLEDIAHESDDVIAEHRLSALKNAAGNLVSEYYHTALQGLSRSPEPSHPSPELKDNSKDPYVIAQRKAATKRKEEIADELAAQNKATASHFVRQAQYNFAFFRGIELIKTDDGQLRVKDDPEGTTTQRFNDDFTAFKQDFSPLFGEESAERNRSLREDDSGHISDLTKSKPAAVAETSTGETDERLVALQSLGRLISLTGEINKLRTAPMFVGRKGPDIKPAKQVSADREALKPTREQLMRQRTAELQAVIKLLPVLQKAGVLTSIESDTREEAERQIIRSLYGSGEDSKARSAVKKQVERILKKHAK